MTGHGEAGAPHTPDMGASIPWLGGPYVPTAALSRDVLHHEKVTELRAGLNPGSVSVQTQEVAKHKSSRITCMVALSTAEELSRSPSSRSDLSPGFNQSAAPWGWTPGRNRPPWAEEQQAS